MTADSRRVYFAASHAHPAQAAHLRHGRQQAGGSGVQHPRARSGDRSVDAVAIDAENLYLVSNNPGDGGDGRCVIRTRKLGTAGRRFSLDGVPDDLDSLFEAVRGAIFLNDEIVVLMQRTTGEARLSIARFKPDGGYVPNSFTVLGTPDGVDPRGMTLAGNRVYLLDTAQLLALDRGFAYVQT